MKFIQLTLNTSKPVFINVNQIVAFYSSFHDDQKFTQVITTMKDIFTVQEHPSKILDAFENLNDDFFASAATDEP